jgi:NusA-like KH domain protein
MAERIVFSTELIKFISLFEHMTHVSPKDCFEDANGTLLFIVPEGKIAKALGKSAVNAKNLERKLNRKLRIIEYKEDVKSFIKSLLFPLKVNDVSEIEEGIFQIEPIDHKTRGLIIGRAASNLRNTEKTAKRFFDIKEIKVL